MRKIFILLALLTLTSGLFAKSYHENWTDWNVSYYDYTDDSSHQLLRVLFKKMDVLKGARNLDGQNNPLVTQKAGVETLYITALNLWADYLKFALCGAEGLENLSDEEIELYNENFPDLHQFAQDFFIGEYTNGQDPFKFFLMPQRLGEHIVKVEETIRNMSAHVDFDNYMKHFTRIPRLTRNMKVAKKHSGAGGFVTILVILGAVAALLWKWAALMKIPAFAKTLGKADSFVQLLREKITSKLKKE